MTVEVRRDNYIFSDLRAEFDEEIIPENHIDTIFPNDKNQVEDENNVTEMLATRVAHLSGSIEDQEKHVQLQDDLLHHIVNNY